MTYDLVDTAITSFVGLAVGLIGYSAGSLSSSLGYIADALSYVSYIAGVLCLINLVHNIVCHYLGETESIY